MGCIDEKGLTENTRRLLKGLLARGVTFPSAVNYCIVRDSGQGMMNKAAGEAAPTWYLKQDVYSLYRPNKARWRNWGGTNPKVTLDDREYLFGVASHVPLTFILKHPPDQWQFQGRFGVLRVTVGKLPPHWDCC